MLQTLVRKVIGDYWITVPKQAYEEAEELKVDIEEILRSSIRLGLVAMTGDLYQCFNDQYFKVTLEDFGPLPNTDVSWHFSFIKMSVNEDIMKEINKSGLPFYEWMAKAINLRIRARYMNLHYLKDGSYVYLSDLTNEIEEEE